jgi:hypothetical protein
MYSVSDVYFASGLSQCITYWGLQLCLLLVEDSLWQAESAGGGLAACGQLCLVLEVGVEGVKKGRAGARLQAVLRHSLR